MLEIGADGYNIQCAVGTLPVLYNKIVGRAELHEDFGVREPEGESVFIAVSRGDTCWPHLAVSLRCATRSGFYPGLFLIPENNLLLIGAAERLLAYDLKMPHRLWEDTTMCGFWHWRRHTDIVIMSAELELAAYSLRGERLWSRFVEPPWDYAVIGERVQLDVMGEKSNISLLTGA